VAKNIVGSLRDFQVNGISYRVAFDANLTEIFTKFENSLIATSGLSMRKMMKRVPSREGMVLITNSAEREQLKLFAESTEDLEMSYTTAAGDTYSAVGTFEIENNESEENRTTLQLLPNDDWTLFEG
jgi:hypothetical protein